MIGDSIGFHVKEAVVGACFDDVAEGLETLLKLLFLSSGVSRCGAGRHNWCTSSRRRESGDDVLWQGIELFNLSLFCSDPRLIVCGQPLQIQWSQPAITAANDHLTMAF